MIELLLWVVCVWWFPGFVGCCAWRVLYAVQLRSVGVVWLVLLVALLVVGLVVVWCFLLLM